MDYFEGLFAYVNDSLNMQDQGSVLYFVHHNVIRSLLARFIHLTYQGES